MAVALAKAGWRTAIIEKGRVGGTCVVRGCTPTKTMIASARVAHMARRAGDYGVLTGQVSVDMECVRRRKRTIVDQWSSGSQNNLERQDGLELIFGKARFLSRNRVHVALNDGGVRELMGVHIFINAGARPRIPTIPGLGDVPFLDSTSIMELTHVPDHLIVLGGGFIGLEFGQMFRRFGSQVTIIEPAERLGAREDLDIGRALAEVFESEGINILTSMRAEVAERTPDGDVAILCAGPAGTRRIVGSDLLVSVGLMSNADSLDLAAAGLEADAAGWIPVDEHLQTDVPGIWALGDITGAPPFTHTAYDDYRVIKANILGGHPRSTMDRLVPYTVFTDPQLGRVGLTEREARYKGFNIRVATLPMTRVARAIELGETRGLMKAVVDADSDMILGAAVLGIEGGEVIAVLQMAMIAGLPYPVLRDAVFSHPTLAESINNLFMTLDN